MTLFCPLSFRQRHNKMWTSTNTFLNDDLNLWYNWKTSINSDYQFGLKSINQLQSRVRVCEGKFGFYMKCYFILSPVWYENLFRKCSKNVSTTWFRSVWNVSTVTQVRVQIKSTFPFHLIWLVPNGVRPVRKTIDFIIIEFHLVHFVRNNPTCTRSFFVLDY